MCDSIKGVNNLVTGEAVALSVRPASLMSRGVACAIDYAVYLLVYIALTITIFYFFDRWMVIEPLLASSLSVVFMALATVMVPCTVEILLRGRSVGKLVMGLRIVRDDGGAITFRHAFLRALMYDFEVLSTSGGIAALAGLLSPQTKRLGDMLAGTIAVSERPRRLRHTSPVVAPHLTAWATQVDVTPVPSGLFYRVTQFLDTSSKITPASRLERAIELAEEVNPYVAPAPPEGTHPEDFLAALVALTRTAQFTRVQKAEASADQFSQRAGTLPYGLHV